jgi:hypothetical protein
MKILAPNARKPRQRRPHPLPLKTIWFSPPSMFLNIHFSIATEAQAHPITVNIERNRSSIHPKYGP